MERLRKAGAVLVCRCAKQHSEPTSDKRGEKIDEITLTPLELIDRIAALMPPPRTQHRYCGVLAPNSPLRGVVTALAQAAPAQPATGQRSMPLATPRMTVRASDGCLMWQTPLARELLERYCGTQAPTTPEPVLAGCSARRCECRVAGHTNEQQRRHAPARRSKMGCWHFLHP